MEIMENTIDKEIATDQNKVPSVEEIADRRTELGRTHRNDSRGGAYGRRQPSACQRRLRKGYYRGMPTGGMQLCAIVSMTLQGGVERILKERLPWVTEVVGNVDASIDPFESEAMGQGAYVPRRDLMWGSTPLRFTRPGWTPGVMVKSSTRRSALSPWERNPS